MSGYVEKISVRSDTSFIHHTLLLNNPNWTVPRKKVILLLSHYWVLSLIAVFLRFNWNASLGVDDLGFDSFIYVPLPQSHWLIRFVSLNSLSTQLNVCICDSLLVWHIFLVSVTVWTGVEGSHGPNPNFQNWIPRLLLNFTFVRQRRNRQEKLFSLLPSSLYSFFIQGFARRFTDNLFSHNLTQVLYMSYQLYIHNRPFINKVIFNFDTFNLLIVCRHIHQQRGIFTFLKYYITLKCSKMTFKMRTRIK